MNKRILICLSAIAAISLANAGTLKGKTMCNDEHVVELTTNYGTIDVALNQDKAPVTVKNFIHYVNKGFYNDKIFHRVISGFMIQGGGFDAKMNQASTDAPIKNEASNGLKNDKYTIAMARTNDPNSATAQFFINVKDNDFLNYSAGNPGYAVFGKVIKGQDVVDKIASVKTTSVGYNQDVPVDSVIIKNAKLIDCKK
jgi:peptidyl-prolyl cis-trans isomerase B (cyclophilin B)